MRHAQKLTWILLLLPILSWGQSIDLDQKTVILDKEQTITLAKIVRNETRLADFVEELRVDMGALRDSIQGFAARTQEQRERLQELAVLNDSLYLQLYQLQEERKEPPKPARGLYGLFQVSGNQDQINGVNIGAQLLLGRTFIQAGVDPFIFERPSYLLGVGFRIF